MWIPAATVAMQADIIYDPKSECMPLGVPVNTVVMQVRFNIG